METIYIYNGASRISIPVTDSAERSHSLQQHNYVKLVWKSAENTPILANAYIEYEGQVFYCIEEYYPTHKEGIYEYEVEFHAIEDTFNRPLFFRHVDILDQATGETTSWKEIEWSLNSNLRTIAEIVVDSLNRAYDNAYFALPNDSYADTLLLSYSFASNSIADALSTIAEQNETEWWLETTTEYVDGKRKYILHFDKCELGDTIELNDNYTEDANGVWQSGGLKSVSQSGNTNIIPQKLYVYGSERNIIKKTVEKEVAGGVMNVSYDKKLRLPKRLANNTNLYYLESVGILLTINDDSSITISGINNKFEQVKIFDEVYPKMNMTVKGVSVQNPNSENPIYWLKGDRLKSITTENPADDSINPGKLGLLIEGCTLMCTFTSGLLNGREFECSWRESTAEIGLIPIDENDVQIPSGVFKPQEGDTFILWNLAMPQSSIDIAQKELFTEAVNYIEELVTSITETDCTTEAEATRISGLNTKIKVGQRISVNSNVFRNGRLSSRIIKYSYKLTKPYDVNFTLASSRQTGRLAALENMIADTTHEVHSVGQTQRAISRRQWHDTEEMMSMLDSIQKQMVVVGDENNAFTTTCNVELTSAKIKVSEGYIQHQSYTENEWKGAWLVGSTFEFDFTSANANTPFYLYFRANKNDNSAICGISHALPQETDDFYVLNFGIVSSEYEGERVFNQSSGLTSIAGGTITTDVIQDPARRLVIDYSNATIIARNGGTIRGAIQFEKGEGENDLGTAIDNLLGGVNDARNTANSADSKATQAQTTATNAQKQVQDLQIGGRNLLLDSKSLSLNDDTNNNYKQKWYFPTTMPTKDKTYTFSCKKSQLIDGTATEWHLIFHASSGGNMTYKMPFSDEPQTKTVTIGSNKVIDGFLIYAGLQGSTAGNNCYWEELKLEEGNKATGWTPAPEDVDADIQEAKDSIDAVSGSLDDVSAQLEDAFKDGYFNKTEQKALKASVGELENSYNAFVKEYLDVANSKYLDDVSVTISGTSYTTPKTSLITKYNALVSAYNNYHGVLQGLCNVKFGTITKPNIGTVAEVSIPNTDSRLTSVGIAFRDTYLTAYTNRVSEYKQALSVAQENIRVNMQKESESYADNKVDNLEIGGTNLLPFTKTFKSNPKLSSYSHLSEEKYNDFGIRYFDATSLSSNYMEFAAWNIINTATNNDEFTCSFYAKGSGQVQVFLYSNSYNGLYVIKTITSQGNTWTSVDGACYIYLTDTWTRYWITWKLGNPSSITTRGNNLLFRLFSGNALYLCGCQLEKGNKATEWKPAPEDIDAEIADTMNAIETLNDDSIFQQSEKLTIRKEWEEISGTAVTPSDTADVEVPTTYGDSGSYQTTVNLIPSGSGISHSDLDVAISKLRTYLNNHKLYRNNKKLLRVGETDPAVTSNFSRSTLAQRFQAYYTAEANIIKTINDYFAKKQVQDLQISGVNLLPNSKINALNHPSGSNWVGYGSTLTLQDGVLRGTTGANNYPRIANLYSQNIDIVVGQEYTISLWARANANCSRAISIGLNSNDTSCLQFGTMALTTEWKKFEFTQKAKTTSQTTAIFIYTGDTNTQNTSQWIEIKEIQLEKGNKATEWKPNDADTIEARTNILKDGMMQVYSPDKGILYLNLTESLKPYTEYVFSIERATANVGFSIGDEAYSYSSLTTNTKNATYVTFTTGASVGQDQSIWLEDTSGADGNITLVGIKLAEGNKYVGYEATPEEKDAIMALQGAMKGSTDIIGGLMLTQLIGMKGDDNSTINAGISGRSDWNNLRFWAGSSWSGASTAPFRVYNDGRVFGTHFYGFFSAFEVNTSNINSVSSTSGSYKKLNLNVTGSNILLNYSSAYVTLPSDIKYVGSEVQIYNPNRYSIPTCNFVPYYSQCTIKNYEQTVSLTRTSYLGAISVSTTGGIVPTSISVPRWSVQMNTCSNYKPAYVKFRAVKTTLSLVSGYKVYVPYWLKNCLYSGSISNTASYPFGDSQAYYLVNSTCTFVIWIMVEYSTTMS